MNKKVNFLKSFPEIKEKGELYNLYRGFVYSLDNFEAFELLTNSETIGLRGEALISKIQYSSKKYDKNQNSKLFDKAIDTIGKLKWPQSQRIAKVLYGISTSINNKDCKNLIKYFLRSRYTSFRQYAYDIIERYSLKTDFKRELLDTWGKHKDIEILDLVVDLLSPKDLFAIYNDAEEVLADSEFDFEILKLRNKYYSKIIKYIPKKLTELQTKDPVSFVFVMKDAGRKIDEDLAMKIYKKNKDYRSLLACYGEMGMWKVLVEIYSSYTTTEKSVKSYTLQE